MSTLGLIMCAAPSVVQGQYVFGYYTNGNVFDGTWTVPAGVTSICVVCVQPGRLSDLTYNSSSGQGASTVTRSDGTTVICRAQNGNFAGYTGYVAFTGGTPGANTGATYAAGGGGGAAGYAGNGGNGGAFNGTAATAGSGGGGGGGGGAAWAGPADSNFMYSPDGGGVGLLGQGTNGYAGSNATVAGPSGGQSGGGGGSGGSVGGTVGGGDPLYGGGQGGVYWQYTSSTKNGGQGGGLCYVNNVPVTPGEVLNLHIGDANTNDNGGIRIIWGPGRAYPSTNTGNV